MSSNLFFARARNNNGFSLPKIAHSKWLELLPDFGNFLFANAEILDMSEGSGGLGMAGMFIFNRNRSFNLKLSRGLLF